jgi:hypothetical protein
MSVSHQLAPERDQVPTFGTTVVDTSGLQGQLYLIPVDSDRLPNFKHLKPVGTLYTTRLNIPNTYFEQGFPGVTSRFEWFAIDYTGRFWINQAGSYRFGLISDDGSKLYIDGHVVIDNDGLHAAASCIGSLDLTTGVHMLRLSYFQGPRAYVALMLGIAKTGDPWRVFDTRNFKPPLNVGPWPAEDTKRDRKQSSKVQRGNCWTR